ncbi:TPA-induced transmembrane protein homolog [Pholidichthys leucotaenia]
MDEEIAMERLNHGAANDPPEATGNGDTVDNNHPVEENALLENGVRHLAHDAEVQVNGSGYAHNELSVVKRVREQLCERVVGKLRVWMIIIGLIFSIILVIFISMAVHAAIYKDEDDIFDPSLFKVPLFFNGSFQLPNKVFIEQLLSISSEESKVLAAHLKEKLTDLYRSSPALGRYFSEAQMNSFRNGSVIADYTLMFLLPEEEQDRLRKFTLSREMVYNVFRQFLYDQDPSESGQMYIDPASLRMFPRH